MNDAEALIILQDLEEEFRERPEAKAYFLELSRVDKRNILYSRSGRKQGKSVLWKL